MSLVARTSRWAKVRSGVLTAGAWLLGIGWLLLALIGAGIAFSETRYPHLLGWLALAAGVAAIITMDRWVKVLPGILGISILNAILALWNGYIGIDPTQKFTRTAAAIVLVCLIACSVLATTLTSRRLNRIDRVALFVFLISLGWSIARFPYLLGFGLMLSCLVVAWANDRIQRHRRTGGQVG
jgi:hypothetical protein